MSTTVVILVVVLLLVVAAVPAWPHARGFGYGPMGVLLTLLVVLLVLHLMGVLR